MISAPSCFIFQKRQSVSYYCHALYTWGGKRKPASFALVLHWTVINHLSANRFGNPQKYNANNKWWTSSSYQHGRTLLPACPQRSQSVQTIRPCGLRKISMRCVHKILGKILPEKIGAAPHKGLVLAALGPSEHAPKKSRKNTSLLSTANLIHSRCFLQPSPPHKPIFWDTSWPDRTDQWNCTLAQCHSSDCGPRWVPPAQTSSQCLGR